MVLNILRSNYCGKHKLSYAWRRHTKYELKSASSPDDSQVAYWKTITEFYNTYSVLLLNSLGLQDAIDRSPVNLPHFFSRCLKAATDCAKCIKDALGPRGYLRYSPLSHFIQGSYAVLTLLKVCHRSVNALAALTIS